jgi:hypothetical protein
VIEQVEVGRKPSRARSISFKSKSASVCARADGAGIADAGKPTFGLGARRREEVQNRAPTRKHAATPQGSGGGAITKARA